jgi:nucleolar protein 56
MRQENEAASLIPFHLDAHHQVQTGITDLARFQRVVKMTAFHPFDTAENALENINAITEHEMTEDLRTFLESNLSKGKKASKFPLGVVSSSKCRDIFPPYLRFISAKYLNDDPIVLIQIEPTLATAIQENLGIPCRSDESIREITRGIRAHFVKFVKPLAGGGLEQAQLGLGHSYSRGKVSIMRITRKYHVNMSFFYCPISMKNDSNLHYSLTSAAETTNPSL